MRLNPKAFHTIVSNDAVEVRLIWSGSYGGNLTHIPSFYARAHPPVFNGLYNVV
jgi:hypothetical protein